MAKQPKKLPSSEPSVSWSPVKRGVVSIVLVCYLLVLFFGPMTNPIATEELTVPIARTLRPAHQALFLGHGYRFFAPNPGPSHRVPYKIYNGAELVAEGTFPDRERNWPRVIYHRWFMLSETLFEELNQTPDQESFDESQRFIQEQIERFQQAGQGRLAAPLIARHERFERMYPQTLKRIDGLKQSIAQKLMEQFGGTRIELFVQERGLPTPAQIVVGEKLNDSRRLSEPILIGEYRRDDELPPPEVKQP